MFVKMKAGLKAYKLWSRLWELIENWGKTMGEEKVNGVPVKSAWMSKINWTQGVALAGTVLAMFGLNLTPEQQASLVSGITVVAAILTWFFRTFKNNTVTPGANGTP